MSAHSISKLEMGKEGSTVLLVLLITGCLLSSSIGFWQSSIRSYELTFERIQYEQRFRLTEGALLFGISYAKKKSGLLKKEYEIDLSLDEYAQLLADVYTVQLKFIVQKESIRIIATTYDQGERVCRLGCRLEKSTGDVWTVCDWQLCTE